jgi:hypothetical protein
MDSVKLRPEWTMVPSAWKDLYMRSHVRYWAASNDSVRTMARRQRYMDVRSKLVKAIADSGGKLLISSDTP